MGVPRVPVESREILREPLELPWEPSPKQSNASLCILGGPNVAHTRLAEVGDLQHAPRAQQQVRWLDISMEQALRW